MVIPNIVTRFHKFDIFYNLFDIFELSSAHACRVQVLKNYNKIRHERPLPFQKDPF